MGIFSRALIRLTARTKEKPEPPPLLVELFGRLPPDRKPSYESYPFVYSLSKLGPAWEYNVSCDLPDGSLLQLRKVVQEVCEALDPGAVEPLTFGRLIEVLGQLAAGRLGDASHSGKVKELGELVAYEAVGLSRVLAIAKDAKVTEFYMDSDSSPLYLDHTTAGRCETGIMLTERERRAIETHIDTFRGYTIDYANPSLKNDLEIAGARLRISLDLGPISVNRFSLDVRRLNVASLSLDELVGLGVLSAEAAAFLVAWLELGGNITIIGETGTGKTTLMNALDEQVEPRLRRIYIEDAVETKDMLERGYHQMKIKVDPFERGSASSHSKETEIVKVLHRSPDMVILSEIQSAEHSRAFYHALSAGVRGMQTFHASSVEQAIRRWTDIHGVPRPGLLDLGVLVQMLRPDRLGPSRIVARVCQIVSDSGEPRVRELYARDREGNLRRIAEWECVGSPGANRHVDYPRLISEIQGRLGRKRVARP